MKALELNKMGLAPMQTCELQEVDGGISWPGWQMGLAAGATATTIAIICICLL